MPTRSPCILVAEPTVLRELLAGCTLREGFLRPWNERLEDTATEAFVHALRDCGFLAMSSRVLQEDATDEPLSAEARRDYLSNLEQRLRRSTTVHLHVVRRDDPPDWSDRVAEVIRRACGTDGQAQDRGDGQDQPRVAGRHFLVVVHLCAIDEARHSQLQKLEALKELRRRYLMTEELHESGANLVQAEWVWPSAVGRLLTWLQASEDETHNQGWLAWQSVDIGPRPPDESLERTRKAVTQRLLLPDPSQGGQIEHPSIPTPRPAERLASDPLVTAIREDTAGKLDHGSVALEVGLRGLRMTPGDAEGPSWTSGPAPTAFEGWLSVGERFGLSVARTRDRAAAAMGAVDQPHPDLAKFISYISQIHDDASKIRAITEGGPPVTGHQSGAREARPDEHRSRLSGFADLRVKRRAAAHSLLLAGQERDRADARLLPLRGRVAFGIIALACTLATWLALSGFLIESWSGVNPVLLHGCIVGGSLLGFLAGAIVPWLIERSCMERADHLLGGNIRQRVEDRIADIEAIRSDLIEPADQRRREHAGRIAWEQARDHCLRLQRIIEKAIADAQVPGLAARTSEEASVPDEFRNLWREDSLEFRDATVEAIAPPSPMQMEQLARTVEDDLSPKPAPSGTAKQSTNGKQHASDANGRTASPDASSINEYATRWKFLTDLIDPKFRAHLPSHLLQVELGMWTTGIRENVANRLTDDLVGRIKAHQIGESKFGSIERPDFLSCRVAGCESMVKWPPDLLTSPRLSKGHSKELLSKLREWLLGSSKDNSRESEWVASLALWYREVEIKFEVPEPSDPVAPRKIVLKDDLPTGGSTS